MTHCPEDRMQEFDLTAALVRTGDAVSDNKVKSEAANVFRRIRTVKPPILISVAILRKPACFFCSEVKKQSSEASAE